MPRSRVRAYSRYSTAALELLASQIRTERLRQKITVQELAERAGVSRSLVQRVEKGDPGTAIGVVFELAAILSIPLFEEALPQLSGRLSTARETLRLLPKAAHRPDTDADDDF